MKSTNVHSNSKEENQEINNPSLFSGQTIANSEGKIEMPPKAASTGISERKIKVAEANGEVLEIPVGKCIVKENNMMELADGSMKEMKNPEAYKNIAKNNKTRKEMKEKAEKAQAGIEIG